MDRIWIFCTLLLFWLTTVSSLWTPRSQNDFIFPTMRGCRHRRDHCCDGDRMRMFRSRVMRRLHPRSRMLFPNPCDFGSYLTPEEFDATEDYTVPFACPPAGRRCREVPLASMYESELPVSLTELLRLLQGLLRLSRSAPARKTRFVKVPSQIVLAQTPGGFTTTMERATSSGSARAALPAYTSAQQAPPVPNPSSSSNQAPQPTQSLTPSPAISPAPVPAPPNPTQPLFPQPVAPRSSLPSPPTGGQTTLPSPSVPSQSMSSSVSSTPRDSTQQTLMALAPLLNQIGSILLGGDQPRSNPVGGSADLARAALPTVLAPAPMAAATLAPVALAQPTIELAAATPAVFGLPISARIGAVGPGPREAPAAPTSEARSALIAGLLNLMGSLQQQQHAIQVQIQQQQQQQAMQPQPTQQLLPPPPVPQQGRAVFPTDQTPQQSTGAAFVSVVPPTIVSLAPCEEDLGCVYPLQSESETRRKCLTRRLVGRVEKELLC